MYREVGSTALLLPLPLYGCPSPRPPRGQLLGQAPADALTCTLMPGIRAWSARGPTTVQAYLRCSAALPPTWSPWWWVLRM